MAAEHCNPIGMPCDILGLHTGQEHQGEKKKIVLNTEISNVYFN